MVKGEAMKKILLFSHGMELGGAERALLGLMQNLDLTKYQVDLFLMRKEGELLKYIPQGIHLLPGKEEYTCLAVPISRVAGKKKWGIFKGRIIGKVKAACFVKCHGLRPDNGVALEYSHKYTCRYMPAVSDTEYDLAISFLTPHYFAAKKAKAKKRIAWIHTDYTSLEIDVNSERRMWSAYDRIVSVSEECSRGFAARFPNLADRLVCIGHILPVDFIKNQAVLFDAAKEMTEDGSFRILSVGRFCYAKNFDNVPDICKRIVEAGYRIRWYLIGFGPDEELIRQRIREAEMEEHVILLGKRENPYPYMRACDLYVQPSRYEGSCVCVYEARVLGKPVLITNYETAKSQLKDKVDGVIVPADNKGCAEGIISLIRNSKLRERLAEHAAETDYVNHTGTDRLYALIENMTGPAGAQETGGSI